MSENDGVWYLVWVSDFNFPSTWILSSMACLNVDKTSCIIFWTDLLWSGRYKISWISQRVIRVFVEKWFFIFDKNQLVINSKLFRWSAKLLASLPLTDNVMISFILGCGVVFHVANSLCSWICNEAVHSPKCRICQDICYQVEQMVWWIKELAFAEFHAFQVIYWYMWYMWNMWSLYVIYCLYFILRTFPLYSFDFSPSSFGRSTFVDKMLNTETLAKPQLNESIKDIV